MKFKLILSFILLFIFLTGCKSNYNVATNNDDFFVAIVNNNETIYCKSSTVSGYCGFTFYNCNNSIDYKCMNNVKLIAYPTWYKQI